METKLKVEFIDNSSSQYDGNASEIKLEKNKNCGKLFLGDRYAASYVQLKFRSCKSVINCSKDLHGFSKEPDVKYLNIDPEIDENNNYFEEAYNFIEQELMNGRNIVVYCESGNGKSAAVVIFYVMKKKSVSLCDSYRLLQTFKKDIRTRPDLMKILIQSEKKLRNSVSMAVIGRKVEFLDSYDMKYQPNKDGKNKSKGTNPIYILVGITAFFAIVYGILVAITGKA
eukprot:gene9925-13349_t